MDTTQLPPDFKEFLKLFVAHEIKFLLIGGYAVNAFGYSRNTNDMDVWVENSASNRQKVIRALRAFGFSSTPDNALDEPNAMLRMGVPPMRIELLQEISGVQFQECWPRRVSFRAGDVEIPLIALQDLIANKPASGRDKDLLDVKELL